MKDHRPPHQSDGNGLVIVIVGGLLLTGGIVAGLFWYRSNVLKMEQVRTAFEQARVAEQQAKLRAQQAEELARRQAALEQKLRPRSANVAAKETSRQTAGKVDAPDQPPGQLAKMVGQMIGRRIAKMVKAKPKPQLP